MACLSSTAVGASKKDSTKTEKITTKDSSQRSTPKTATTFGMILLGLSFLLCIFIVAIAALLGLLEYGPYYGVYAAYLAVRILGYSSYESMVPHVLIHIGHLLGGPIGLILGMFIGIVVAYVIIEIIGKIVEKFFSKEENNKSSEDRLVDMA